MIADLIEVLGNRFVLIPAVVLAVYAVLLTIDRHEKRQSEPFRDDYF